MDGKDRFNFGSRVSFRFVSGFSVSRFTTTLEHSTHALFTSTLIAYCEALIILNALYTCIIIHSQLI